MLIRLAVEADLPELSAIFARARDYMVRTGNPTQWGDAYPPEELIRSDIAAGSCHVCEVDGRIQCTFSAFPEGDPSYSLIWDGAWPDDGPYCAVHRVATRGEVRGIARHCLRWCVERWGRVRIDTHADNLPMQHILEQLGFVRCGKVPYRGEERIAYQNA